MLLQRAFTLLELAAVITIIGLIAGGILATREFTRSAGVRATIAQISAYNHAVHTFEDKFGGLPGDINSTLVTRLGLAARGSYAGEGDGDGIIEGINSDAASHNLGSYELGGETAMFWSDLTYANGLNLNLIDGTFKSASSTALYSAIDISTMYKYLPEAKIGRNNFIYVWSGGPNINQGASYGNGINYFGLSAVSSLTPSSATYSAPALMVVEAYNIDKKIDDGLPQSGSVRAFYLNSSYGHSGVAWAAGNGNYGVSGGTWGYDPVTTSTAGSATTCYDNGSSSAAQTYSLSQTAGSGINCALSFAFQ